MRLSINETTEVEIKARRRWNETLIEISVGEQYQFTAIGNWTDFIFTKDANGYSNSYMQLFDSWKRSKEHLWFALIGALDKSDYFLIGKNSCKTFSKNGILYCFANDAKAFYWNNFGKIQLEIKRVK